MTGTMSSAYGEDEAPLPVLVLEQYTYCEYPAVANGAGHHGFAVMVHLKAPALVTAPLDLVAVLDVSESMEGSKLAQVKRAMAFVIDRLSVVACPAGHPADTHDGRREGRRQAPSSPWRPSKRARRRRPTSAPASTRRPRCSAAA